MPKLETEYWGLNTIARRMKRSQGSMRTLYDKYGFIMFLLPRDTYGGKVWYTTERMIQLWELSQYTIQRRAYEKRKNGYYRVKGQQGEPKAG